MAVEFRAEKPVKKTIVFKDDTVVEGAIIRPSDLSKGTDATPLRPYLPPNKSEYEAVVNMIVTSKQLLITPGRVNGAQQGIVMKYGAMINGLPAMLPHEGVDYYGTFHPIFPHEKMKVDTNA